MCGGYLGSAMVCLPCRNVKFFFLGMTQCEDQGGPGSNVGLKEGRLLMVFFWPCCAPGGVSSQPTAMPCRSLIRTTKGV